MPTKLCKSVLFATLHFALICAISGSSVKAQAPIHTQKSPVAHAVTKPRLVEAIDESKRISLAGNIHPLAAQGQDLGPAQDGLQLKRLILVLQRSPDQELALGQLLDAQQTRDSGSYHQWLTPAEFGAQFGVADEDIQTVSSWLVSHGFTVSRVSSSRMFIEFSGSAAEVRDAFHTEIRRIHTNGEEAWANVSDPQIPAALAPIIAGVHSLNSFRARPMHHVVGTYHRVNGASKLVPAEPDFTYSCGFDPNTGKNISCYGLGPYDFAAIYNVLPLWNASPAIDGTGQSVAIVAQTNINLQDVADFRSSFGLPANKVNVILDGPDPGLVPGDETEADLDVQWSGAVAKGATIDLVVSQSTETTLGVDLSALYIVDNNLAPVMSESYGVCELFMGTAWNQFYKNLWQQASAQGISVFLASGDSGSATCDRFQGNTPQPAMNGLQVSGFASTPYNVAVGGTDFSEVFDSQLYWNATNNPMTGQSAIGYIPETAWNDSCTNAIFGDPRIGFSINPETNCNNFQLNGFVATVGGGGGKSNCTAPTGPSPLNCSGGYAKPAWQSGTGVPSDGARDLPDVSLFASDGFQGSSYIICELDQSSGSRCPGGFLAIGGTSASSPAFAGILALVNQKTGSRQGNPNYVLYALASLQPPSNCNSSASPLNTCIFNDVTSGTIAMPCAASSANCTVTNPSHTYGVLSGYPVTSGYDLATGLGSVNAFNLVNEWGSVNRSSSTTTLTLNGGSAVNVTHGTPVAAAISVTPAAPQPTGDVSLIAEQSGGAASGFATFSLSSGNASGTAAQLPGGSSYNVKAHYEGDANYGGSDSAPVTVTVNPEASRTALSIVTFDLTTGNITNSNATTVPYLALYLLRADVTNASGSTCMNSTTLALTYACPTGSVSFLDNSAPLPQGATTNLNSAAIAENLTVQLAGGSHNLTGNYSGDNSYTSSSVNAAVTVTPATTVTTFPSGQPPTKAVIGGFSQIEILMKTANLGVQGAFPNDSFALFDGSTQVASGLFGGDVGFFPVTPGSPFGFMELDVIAPYSISGPPGLHTLTARFNGDQNYQTSTSAPLSIDEVYSTTTVLMPSAPSIQYGQNLTLTAMVAPSQSAGIPPSGTVTFSTSNGNVLGSAALTNSQSQITTNAVPGGTTQINANYTGDSNYASSTGTFTETVGPLSSSTSLTSSNLTVPTSTTVMFRATIAPSSSGPALPSGFVTFLLNGLLFDNVFLMNGVAQTSRVFNTAGSFQIQASYSGDSNYVGSNSSLTETVIVAPDFAISSTPPGPIIPGLSAMSTITLSATGGLTGSVALTCSVSPNTLIDTPGCMFSQNSVTLSSTTTSATSVLTVSTTAASSALLWNPRRVRPIVAVQLAMAAVAAILGMFLILILSGCLYSKRRVDPGSHIFWRAAPLGLFALAILVAMTGCGGSGSGGGIHNSNPGTTPGLYTVTINATSGSTVHVITVSVNVQ